MVRRSQDVSLSVVTAVCGVSDFIPFFDGTFTEVRSISNDFPSWFHRCSLFFLSVLPVLQHYVFETFGG